MKVCTTRRLVAIVAAHPILLVAAATVTAQTARSPEASVAEIRKLAPQKRIREYLKRLNGSTAPVDLRHELISALADDARYLSPQYGSGTQRRLNE